MHDIDIQSMGGGLRQLKPPHGHGHGGLKCPRCDSLNTKFCYYNNYNLSQPRFFCKACRRYWTKGGVLRNVPVGGGCRKRTKRSKPISSSSNNHPSTVAVKSSSGGSHSSSSNNSSPATTTAPVAETSMTKISVQETCFDIPVFDTDDSQHNMFSDIGMLKGLMTSSSDGLHVEMASSMQQRGHEWVGGDAAAADGWGLFDDQQETYWWDDNNHHQLNYFP